MSPLQLFDEDIIEDIVRRIVLYATQKGRHLTVTSEELKTFFGIILVSECLWKKRQTVKMN